MLKYKFNNIGVKELMASYNKDTSPFLVKSLPFIRLEDENPVIGLIKDLLFPNYRGCYEITQDEKKLREKMEAVGNRIYNGIVPNLAAFNKESKKEDLDIDKKAQEAVDTLFKKLPEIRELLKKDAEAAFKGDPAARTYTEIIRAYPGFEAITVQRVANILYKLKIPSYPRELTEYAHSKTGIDIHPGAEIGEYFFIDHGSGIVIGETTEIGKWVRIYQGVTLGVLHFEKDEGGILKKGYERHPTIGDHVVIGAGAKILGPVKMGDHVNIGANCWITEDIKPYTTVFIAEHPKHEKRKK